MDRGAGKPVLELAQLPVFGAKIVAPVADAVGLVDGEGADVDALQHLVEVGLHQPFGRDEDEPYARGTCTVSVQGLNDTYEKTCISDGGTFTRSLSGSHNVVIGSGHGYSSFGGMVVGEANLITGKFAVVSAGAANTASGDYGGVSAGGSNTASGGYSGVSGGFGNTASGSFGSSVSGGDSIVEGTADGWAAGGFNTPAFHSP